MGLGGHLFSLGKTYETCRAATLCGPYLDPDTSRLVIKWHLWGCWKSEHWTGCLIILEHYYRCGCRGSAFVLLEPFEKYVLKYLQMKWYHGCYLFQKSNSGREKEVEVEVTRLARSWSLLKLGWVHGVLCTISFTRVYVFKSSIIRSF